MASPAIPARKAATKALDRPNVIRCRVNDIDIIGNDPRHGGEEWIAKDKIWFAADRHRRGIIGYSAAGETGFSAAFETVADDLELFLADAKLTQVSRSKGGVEELRVAVNLRAALSFYRTPQGLCRFAYPDGWRVDMRVDPEVVAAHLNGVNQ